MAAIPTDIFHDVEWHLHREPQLIWQAERARGRALDCAFSTGCMIGDGLPHGKGRHSEATANKALLLVQAGLSVEQARAWVAAIRQTYAYYRDTDVARMAAGYYGQRVTLRALAEQMGVAEKTLNRHRDKFVSTCALFAAAGGVVKITEESTSCGV